MGFVFDVRVQRYRNAVNGRFVAGTEIEQLLKDNIHWYNVQVNKLNNQLTQDKINVGQWEEEMRELLKMLYTQNYILGRGGVKSLEQSDYDILGQKIAFEFRYLRNLTRDLVLGRLSAAQFHARSRMYVTRSRAYLQFGKAQGHKTSGFQWEKRVRNVLESCEECIEMAAAGWQPIGSLPEIGQACSCRGNCKCHFEYSRERPKDTILQRKSGWLALYRPKEI